MLAGLSTVVLFSKVEQGASNWTTVVKCFPTICDLFTLFGLSRENWITRFNDPRPSLTTSNIEVSQSVN